MIEIWQLLIGGFNQIRQIVAKRKELKESDKSEILANFVNPTFEQLREVHNDYVNSFIQLLENIDKKKDPIETIEIFKKNRLTRLADRIELQSFSREVVETEMKRFMGNKILESFCRYKF